MGKSDVSKNFKSQFERILKIDNLIRNKEYPTTKHLSEKLELSERQIQRRRRRFLVIFIFCVFFRFIPLHCIKKM